MRIRQLRAQMGKTQEQFAELAGISVDFLSLIERGRNAPSFKKLERMSKGLNTPVASFFAFDSLNKSQGTSIPSATVRTTMPAAHRRRRSRSK